MALRINQIHVKNFKIFEDFYQDFQGTDLTVLDGPNGFGKTTFFDSVQLLITGEVRRYASLAASLEDTRRSMKGDFYYRNGASDGLFIKLSITVGGKDYYLMRSGSHEELSRQDYIRHFRLPLYELSNFEDNDSAKVVEDEEDFWGTILGPHLLDSFNYINYVEQEDFTHWVNQKDLDRKSSISHFFNTGTFEKRISSIDLVLKRVNQICSPVVKDNIKSFEQSLAEMDLPDCGLSDSHYFKLLPHIDEKWDERDITFHEGDYARYQELLSSFDDMAINYNKYSDLLFNRSIDNLVADREALANSLSFYHFINDFDALNERYNLLAESRSLLDTLSRNSALSIVKGHNFNISAALWSRLDKIYDYSILNSTINQLRLELDSVSGFDEAISNIRSLRSNLETYSSHGELSKYNNKCLYCGYEYFDAAALAQNVASQEEHLKSLSSSFTEQLTKKVHEFETTYLFPLKAALTAFISNNEMDVRFVESMIGKQQRFEYYRNIIEWARAVGVNVDNFLNTKPEMGHVLQVDEFSSQLRNRRHSLGEFSPSHQFDDDLARYFEGKIELVKLITPESVRSKLKYISEQYALSQNKRHKDNLAKCRRLKRRYDKAKQLSQLLKRLKRTYKESLDSYHTKIISDIGILFHIYSSRIMQNCSSGLGLFLHFDEGKTLIKFVEDVSKSHDAIFRLSTGQKAALVLAFTLSLNAKYSRSKILFIDDPVHTLDDINIAGFIELLRNSFSDRQFFISTHEDRMSRYIRYKFEMLNYQTQSIDLSLTGELDSNRLTMR